MLSFGACGVYMPRECSLLGVRIIGLLCGTVRAGKYLSAVEPLESAEVSSV